MPIHVVARGALIGGAVGAAIALVRTRKGEKRGSEVVRFGKSIAEGAVAGAGVGFLLDRRLRAAATTAVVEHGPELLDSARELATQAYDTARPPFEQALGAARPALGQAIEAARPVVIELAGAARKRAGRAVDAARPVVLDLTDRAVELRAS